jgi:hypothetical protein
MRSTGKIDRKTRDEIYNLIQKCDFHPILIDIGASGKPPEIWDALKLFSRYVGFDPDSRDIPDSKSLGYWKADIIDKAVIAGEDESVDIFLTKSPYCSSILPPDLDSLKHYAWHDLFTVLEKTKVSAISLPTLITQIDLERIDWFKTDSQGIDLRLFLSIPASIRDYILAVDIEPGLMPAYIGEDFFTQAHESLIAQGFWLSEISLGGCPRIHQNSINKIFKTKKLDSWRSCVDVMPYSPYYCEARYLRSIEWLKSHNAEERDYILLCIFALIDGKIGYALDVIDAYKEKTNDSNMDNLENILLHKIRKRIWLQEKFPLFMNIYSYCMTQIYKIIHAWG